MTTDHDSDHVSGHDTVDFTNPEIIERIESFATTTEANRYSWTRGFEEANALARALGLVN